jgi:hypothetical protein
MPRRPIFTACPKPGRTWIRQDDVEAAARGSSLQKLRVSWDLLRLYGDMGPSETHKLSGENAYPHRLSRYRLM